MKNFYLICSLLLLMLFLSGCATFESHTVFERKPNEEIVAALSSYNVPQETYDKMIYGKKIEYHDIMNLEESKVPSVITTKYLNDYNINEIRRRESDQEDKIQSMESDQENKMRRLKSDMEYKKQWKDFKKEGKMLRMKAEHEEKKQRRKFLKSSLIKTHKI